MYPNYSETRISLPLIGAFLMLQVIVLIIGLYYLDSLSTVLLSLVPLLLFLNLFSMRVVVGPDFLRLSYGVGLVSYFVPFELIQSCEIVPNKYVTWFYDTSLEYVLRLNLRDGSRLLIGIGDARRLMDMISSRRRR